MQVLIVCLGIWAAYNLWASNDQRVTTNRAIQEFLPQGQAALVAKKRLFSLVQDLNETASTDPAAGQILTEFKIQLHPASGGNSSAPK